MVKKRPQEIEPIDYAPGRPLGVEVLTVQQLRNQEHGRDLGRPMRPAFHHLYLATQGSGTLTVDFEGHRLQPGMSLFAAAGQVQQFGREPGFDALMMVFRPEFVRFAPQGAGVPQHLDAERGATAAALFKSVRAEAASFDGSQRRLRLLRHLVEATCLALDAEPSLPEGAGLVRDFEAALEKHAADTHEVAAYAAILRCSTRTLTRHCERWRGRSAKRLIDERVVLEAKRLLAHGPFTIADISTRLGFAEPTQFVKFFRRLTGSSPARFRERFQSPADGAPRG